MAKCADYQITKGNKYSKKRVNIPFLALFRDVLLLLKVTIKNRDSENYYEILTYLIE